MENHALGEHTAGSTTEPLMEGHCSAGNNAGPWEGGSHEMPCTLTVPSAAPRGQPLGWA